MSQKLRTTDQRRIAEHWWDGHAMTARIGKQTNGINVSVQRFHCSMMYLMTLMVLLQTVVECTDSPDVEGEVDDEVDVDELVLDDVDVLLDVEGEELVELLEDVGEKVDGEFEVEELVLDDLDVLLDVGDEELVKLLVDVEDDVYEVEVDELVLEEVDVLLDVEDEELGGGCNDLYAAETCGIERE
eukprot:3103411-Amphidinium_carterae.2